MKRNNTVTDKCFGCVYRHSFGDSTICRNADIKCNGELRITKPGEHLRKFAQAGQHILVSYYSRGLRGCGIVTGSNYVDAFLPVNSLSRPKYSNADRIAEVAITGIITPEEAMKRYQYITQEMIKMGLEGRTWYLHDQARTAKESRFEVGQNVYCKFTKKQVFLSRYRKEKFLTRWSDDWAFFPTRIVGRGTKDARRGRSKVVYDVINTSGRDKLESPGPGYRNRIIVTVEADRLNVRPRANILPPLEALAARFMLEEKYTEWLASKNNR